MNITIFEHPLIKHKISLLRKVETGNKEFRELVSEITMLMCFESMRDLELQEVEIKTPITTTKTNMLVGEKMAVIPILRAGLGMVSGVLKLVPNATVGHVGLCRNEETLKPQHYYCKLPNNLDQRHIIVVDTMLATGGSAVDCIDLLKKAGAKPEKIKFMCIIAAPEGVNALEKAHPDINVFCGHLDKCLNENGYIVPGLGDAADRIFGTK